jgi:hypothetical protein
MRTGIHEYAGDNWKKGKSLLSARDSGRLDMGKKNTALYRTMTFSLCLMVVSGRSCFAFYF